MAYPGKQSEFGFSIYRGVVVQWDDDHDERILAVIDQMPGRILDKLLVIQEHKGVIACVWRNSIPKGYEDNNSIVAEDGDYWTTVNTSVIIEAIQITGYEN